MRQLDELQDADLEGDTVSLLESSSIATVPAGKDSESRSIPVRVFWTVAFYTPAAMFPIATRLLVVYRDAAVVGIGSVLRGSAFGCLQDTAVFVQTLVIVRVVQAMRNALLARRSRCCSVFVYSTAVVALGLAYFWMTLACLTDLVLVGNHVPRLNRGFVEMYMNYSDQFASSLSDAVTPAMVVGLLVYASSMVLWIVAVLLDKIKLPSFSIPHVCRPIDRVVPRPQGPYAEEASHRKPSTIASVGYISWAMHTVLHSLTLRTLCVALLASVSALHATLALDGKGNDIHFLSNAMFSLEMEDLLKSSQGMQLSTGGKSAAARAASFQSCVERVIASTEDYVPVVTKELRGKYPLWRKTLGYKGEKRFHVHTNSSNPPNILLLNLESMRSREVGVIGGRENMARYNQTVTPFFDELSRSGVLFRQHYTPSIQTSRTFMSTMFGVLPSLTTYRAVAKASKTPFRLHGLMHILKEAFAYSTMFWSAVDFRWDDWLGFLSKNGFDELTHVRSVMSHFSDEQIKSIPKNSRFSWGLHDAVSFQALENYLEARKQNQTPLFLDVYSISSHDPFLTPPNFTPSTNYSMYITDYNEGYVHALNYVDQQLGKLITNLRAKKLLDNTIVLIEGDHGYGRMEHGDNPTVVSSRVYEEATHIPLLILADGLLREQDKGLVVDDVSSQTDLMATVADMLNIRGFMQHGVGQSLVRKPPATTSTVGNHEESTERRVVLENPYDGKTVGLRVGRDLKYVRYGSGKYMVYNLTSDPLEMDPVEQGQIDNGVHNPVTATQIRYATELVEMTQFMYDTDGFMPVWKNDEKSSA